MFITINIHVALSSVVITGWTTTKEEGSRDGGKYTYQVTFDLKGVSYSLQCIILP